RPRPSALSTWVRNVHSVTSGVNRHSRKRTPLGLYRPLHDLGRQQLPQARRPVLDQLNRGSIDLAPQPSVASMATHKASLLDVVATPSSSQARPSCRSHGASGSYGLGKCHSWLTPFVRSPTLRGPDQPVWRESCSSTGAFAPRRRASGGK